LSSFSRFSIATTGSPAAVCSISVICVRRRVSKNFNPMLTAAMVSAKTTTKATMTGGHQLISTTVWNSCVARLMPQALRRSLKRGRMPVARNRPITLPIPQFRLLEKKNVLERDHVLLHAHHFGDVGNAAATRR